MRDWVEGSVTLEGSILGWLLMTSRIRSMTSSRVRCASWEDMGRASHRASACGWDAPVPAAARASEGEGERRMRRRIAGRSAVAAISRCGFGFYWPVQRGQRGERTDADSAIPPPIGFFTLVIVKYGFRQNDPRSNELHSSLASCTYLVTVVIYL
jgi:hypothetical protein